jgi:hypothetical protein
MLGNLLARRSIKVTRILEFDTLEAIFGCVAAGLGISLLPRALIGQVCAADGSVSTHCPRRTRWSRRYPFVGGTGSHPVHYARSLPAQQPAGLHGRQLRFLHHICARVGGYAFNPPQPVTRYSYFDTKTIGEASGSPLTGKSWRDIQRMQVPSKECRRLSACLLATKK